MWYILITVPLLIASQILPTSFAIQLPLPLFRKQTEGWKKQTNQKKTNQTEKKNKEKDNRERQREKRKPETRKDN